MMRRTTISRPVEIGLRVIGVWPGTPYATMCLFASLSSLAIVQYLQYLYVIVHFDTSNLIVLMDSVSLTMVYTLTTLKLVTLWLNRRLFHDIVNTIEQDWKDVSTTASNLPTMIRQADISRLCSYVVMGVNGGSGFLYIFGDYLQQVIDKSDNEELALPVKMEFPFETRVSPVFEIIMTVQCFYQSATATLAGLFDCILLTLVLHVAGQIDIMCTGLREVSPENRSHGSDSNAIRELVYHHQKIITLSNNISDFFSFIALLQFLWNTLVICCIGLTIVTSIGTENALTTLTKPVTFYVAITLEAFVFCYAGEYLSAKSKSIGDAAYESLWYNTSSSESRILLLIILRSQKQLTITAGRIMDLTLEGFTSIMKASASYASVLRAMY